MISRVWPSYRHRARACLLCPSLRRCVCSGFLCVGSCLIDRHISVGLLEQRRRCKYRWFRVLGIRIAIVREHICYVRRCADAFVLDSCFEKQLNNALVVIVLNNLLSYLSSRSEDHSNLIWRHDCFSSVFPRKKNGKIISSFHKIISHLGLRFGCSWCSRRNDIDCNTMPYLDLLSRYM